MSASLISTIADHLGESGLLKNVQSKGDPVNYETAYVITEIVESAVKLSTNILNALTTPSDPKVYRDAVHDFEVQLRHILYHIEDSEYFSRLLPECR